MSLTTTISSAEELVQQCLSGSSNSYRLLYDRYSKAMYNTALRIVNKVPDAEDILQEAFTDAFLQLKSFENKSTFGAWLKQIVVFKSIRFLNKQKMTFTDAENIMENIADEEKVNEADIHFTIEGIKQKLQQLPDGYRTVLSLYLIEGYDHEEISEILNVAHATVRSQYMRGKQKLLQLLKA